jgi:precorrin-6B C5,15-methyltransferase / cobalt-precorrin-6B C5,C15-methyltransferase
MAEPWLTIIGMGEDGPSGLSDASRTALENASVVFGGSRHLELARAGDRGRPWPVPFSIDAVLALRGQPTVVLASGDPFWFGAGAVLADHLTPDEWISHPAPSAFQLAANALGWRLENTDCLALHAAAPQDHRAHFQRGAQIIATQRDGAAVPEFAAWLDRMGWGASNLQVMERLGGPYQRIREARAGRFTVTDISAPVIVAVTVMGEAPGLPRSPGLPDGGFLTDGQMTKSHIRALTLATLAPRPGEMLWDLGAGSGTISVEWCLAGGRAVAVEQNEKRLGNVEGNATAYGVTDRLQGVLGRALDVIGSLPQADVIFVGGGANDTLLHAVWDQMKPGARLVINAVTLETEALLVKWHQQRGGTLHKFQVSQAEDLGNMRSWIADRPVTQWVVTR